jgi:hypothetical protein
VRLGVSLNKGVAVRVPNSCMPFAERCCSTLKMYTIDTPCTSKNELRKRMRRKKNRGEVTVLEAWPALPR